MDVETAICGTGAGAEEAPEDIVGIGINEDEEPKGAGVSAGGVKDEFGLSLEFKGGFVIVFAPVFVEFGGGVFMTLRVRSRSRVVFLEFGFRSEVDIGFDVISVGFGRDLALPPFAFVVGCRLEAPASLRGAAKSSSGGIATHLDFDDFNFEGGEG